MGKIYEDAPTPFFLGMAETFLSKLGDPYFLFWSQPEGVDHFLVKNGGLDFFLASKVAAGTDFDIFNGKSLK